jgi:hypothetical protein
MILRQPRSSHALIAAAGGALLMGLAATSPAKALDDGADNIFSSIAQLLTAGVGLGGSNVKPPIEYRERPPLVVPPNLQQLPPPGSGPGARNANWPQDFDAQRHRRAVARESGSREAYDEFGGRTAPRNAAGVPVAAQNNPATCDDRDALARLCNPNQFWSTLRDRSQSQPQIAVGQEPPRRALTDPPAGFRRQTTAQQYTFEVERKVDLGDARAQQLEEVRRQRAISRGEDPNF